MNTSEAATRLDLQDIESRKPDRRRILTYADAIREAIRQELAQDPSVLLFGIGTVASDLGIEPGGSERVFEAPLGEEETLSAVAVGMALAGRRPIQVHPHPKHLAGWVDHVVRAASKVRSIRGRSTALPLVIRAIVGHSSEEALALPETVLAPLMRTPGLKVVAPTTPRDAKGALIAAIRGADPVLFLDHRALQAHVGPVPEESEPLSLNRARLMAEGTEITLVGISSTTVECLRARRLLSEAGISCEVIDLLSLNPLDAALVAESVEKTGRLLVIDDGSTRCGAGQEILSRMTERFEGRQAVALHRIGFPSSVCPVPRKRAEYNVWKATGIASRAYAIVTQDPSIWAPVPKAGGEVMDFGGPL
jgi:pyruvate dehydrogenase E1 component beta subunit